MTDSPIINGLAIVFTITTIGVFLYPIIKLAPSWLEGRVNKQVIFHRNAIEAIDIAMALTHTDQEQTTRLAAQRDYHRDALTTLVPDHIITAAPREDITAAA